MHDDDDGNADVDAKDEAEADDAAEGQKKGPGREPDQAVIRPRARLRSTRR